jgi:hypothetical protein
LKEHELVDTSDTTLKIQERTLNILEEQRNNRDKELESKQIKIGARKSRRIPYQFLHRKMSHEEQTKEGCVYAFRRHLSSGGRRRKACQKTPMQETLQQDKEHGAAAHTQEEERQQRAQEGLRNQGGGLPVLPVSRT